MRIFSFLTFLKNPLPSAAALALAAVAVPQAMPKPATGQIDLKNPKYGTLNMQCNLGSFKLLPKLDKAEGRVEVSFTGTLLLSQFEGTKVITGSIRKEYDANQREVYFGTGKAILTGRFRAIQWFGRNMAGTWTGEGVGRLYGEFDQNLQTGKFWYDDPTFKQNWGTAGMQTELPQRRLYGEGTPTPRPKGKPKPPNKT